MKKWQILLCVVLLFMFVGIGVFMNYKGFSENADQQQSERNNTVNSGDATKPKAGEEREKQEPVLELTQDQIELEIGAIFQAIDFISIAKDSYGISVKEKVVVDQEIPTDVPGEYEVTYTLDNGDQVITKVLHVTVRNMSK